MRSVLAADEVSAARADVRVLVNTPLAEGADDRFFDVGGFVGVLIGVERILVDGVAVVVVVAIVFVNCVRQAMSPSFAIGNAGQARRLNVRGRAPLTVTHEWNVMLARGPRCRSSSARPAAL